MKHAAVIFALAFLSCPAIYAQHQHGPAENPATLMQGMGRLRHPVSTTNAEAQKFFDQGLTLIYAFNHEEAVRSFARAAALDPHLAMAYWGIALALGPNINSDVDPEREKAAAEAAQKALALAAGAPENERAYIAAIQKRYSTAPQADLKKLAVDYKNAMGELARRYPADLDAATLYAESMMDLRPWQLWKPDGQPAEGTEEIVAVLESVLRRQPDHVGANHYYIHAVEASAHPERALPSAARLKTLVPAAGHLVHMPAHVYMRTGDYRAAAQSNVEAIAADNAYIKNTGARNMYSLMYYNHKVHFLAIAESMAGRYAEAIKAARQIEADVAPHVKEMPMVEGFMPTPTLVLVRFRRWDEIRRLPEPEKSLSITDAVWHFAQGLAAAAANQVSAAEAHRQAMAAAQQTVPVDAVWGLNKASAVLQVAGRVLDARIALAKHDARAAAELLRQAVADEDALAYDEPPGWFLPVRESLGGLLLGSGDAKQAEAVFRADLAKNPRSGRSLFGLATSLAAQGKRSAAQRARKEFAAAWRQADTKLKISDL